LDFVGGVDEGLIVEGRIANRQRKAAWAGKKTTALIANLQLRKLNDLGGG
jgi:hypothetical protein